MTNGLNHSPLRGGVRLVLATLVLAPLVLACGSSTPGNTWPKGNVVFMDANNYTSQTSLMIPIVPTAPGANLEVCWDQLMKDLLCHDIVAPNNAIDNVGFAKIPSLMKDKVAQQLAVGQFDDSLATTYGDYYTSKDPTSKCVMLSELQLGSEFIDPATDYAAPAAGQTITYMLLFSSGTTPAVGAKSMLFLEPTASATATTVDAIDACSSTPPVLSFTATLGQEMMISATDSSKWHVDWSQITKDSFGNTVNFARLKVDKVLLGFYQDRTAADLQTNFKDIEIIATNLYEVAVPMGARDAKLGDMKERTTGAAFPGFAQTNGVWAIAVQCGKCQVPAPVMLSILKPQ